MGENDDTTKKMTAGEQAKLAQASAAPKPPYPPRPAPAAGKALVKPAPRAFAKPTRPQARPPLARPAPKAAAPLVKRPTPAKPTPRPAAIKPPAPKPAPCRCPKCSLDRLEAEAKKTSGKVVRHKKSGHVYLVPKGAELDVGSRSQRKFWLSSRADVTKCAMKPAALPPKPTTTPTATAPKAA